MSGQNGGGKHVQTRSVEGMLYELEVRDLAQEFAAIAKRRNVLLVEVMGSRRHAEVSAARQECWHVLHERGWSYPRIGELFDRDHTTVIAGVRAHRARQAQEFMAELRRAG